MYTYLHQKPEGLFVIKNEREKPDTFIMPYDKNENEDVDIYDAVISFRISESKKWLSESKHYKVEDSHKEKFLDLFRNLDPDRISELLKRMILIPNECVDVKLCTPDNIFLSSVVMKAFFCIPGREFTI